MKVYVVLGYDDVDAVEINKEEFIKIFISRESAENFINQNDYWLYPRIEEWEAEQ